MSFKEESNKNEGNLKKNIYPGRGMVIGQTPDSKNYVQVYWIMGRSSNSRNRIFESDGDFIRTRAFDESKLCDPSLIIYYPVKSLKGYHIVTNGDQTDTIYDFINNGDSFEAALNTRKFEPDKPNYTPRISGIINTNKSSFALSILKSADGNEEFCIRNYYNYDKFISGFGYCIHTYVEDGNPIPSFKGEPYIVSLENDIDKNAEKYWNILNEDNRISLLVKYINCDTKKTSVRIINKNK